MFSIEDVTFIDPTDQKSKKAYGAVLTGYLASVDPDWAAENADNYMWFAIASYLPQYDWSRVCCRQANLQQYQSFNSLFSVGIVRPPLRVVGARRGLK
jgi:hypothetical protein